MKILEITSDLDGGGVEKLLFEYCSRLKNSHDFDFIVTSEFEGMLEKPLKELGCNIFHVTQLHKGIFKSIKEIKKIIQNGSYDVVHDHSGYKAFIPMFFAKRYKVRKRISHSHIANIKESFTHKCIRKFFTRITVHYSTDLCACGNDAGNWMWGTKKANGKGFVVLPNAIDPTLFSFNKSKREQIRTELNLSNEFVIGIVARFSRQKNLSFAIEVLSDILSIKPNSKLILVGRGELEGNIASIIKEKGLENNVELLGARDDVHSLMNCFDIFMLTSIYEGLPVTAVEAQANGLQVVLSNNITKEIGLSERVKYLDLSIGSKEWANTIANLETNHGKNIIIGTKYDINVSAKELEKLYQQ